MLPHKHAPGNATEKTMRNLEYPLDWESVFATVGERGYLKPIDGGGGRNVHPVTSREEFFRAYDRTGEHCMVYQKEVNFNAYFRCFVVGQKKVRVMEYDPCKPHAERYSHNAPGCEKKLLKRMEWDALKLCQALGYDVNTVEFAIEDEIPYAIDFMNPVPDADLNSVGEEHFEWVVEQLADLAIAKAKAAPQAPKLHWPELLRGEAVAKAAKPVKKKPAAKKKSDAIRKG